MSRSKKKTSMHGRICEESEKKDKKIANKKLRTSTRGTLKYIAKNIERGEDLDHFELDEVFSDLSIQKW